MQYIAEMVERVASIAALAAALEMLLPEGTGKQSVEMLAGLMISLAVAGLLPGLGVR